MNLPVELWTLIFENYLSIQDLVNCRLVCRRWHSIVKCLNINSLVIYDNHPPKYCEKWFGTNNEIDRIHSFKIIKNYESPTINLDKTIFSKTKKLCFYFARIKIQIHTLINSFKCLEQLELVEFDNLGTTKCDLILPNLQILNFDNSFFEHKTNFCFPKLTNLRIINSRYPYQVNRIEIRYPESIVEFICKKFNNDQVKKMKNLQSFYCGKMNQVDDDLLAVLTKLETIYFTGEKNVLNNLIRQKKLYKRNDLKLLYGGINMKMKDLIDFTSIHRLDNKDLKMDQNCIEFISKNYGMVAETLPFLCEIYYDSLENSFDSIPSDLGLRLTDLHTVHIVKLVKHPDQPNRFLASLKSLGKIKNLDIKNSSLNQEFFDQLPHSLPYLRSLAISEKTDFDFNFIFKFKCLEVFRCDQELDLDFVKKVLQHFKCGYISVGFKLNTQSVVLSNSNKKSKEDYSMIKGCRKFGFSDIDDFIPKLKKSKGMND